MVVQVPTLDIEADNYMKHQKYSQIQLACVICAVPVSQEVPSAEPCLKSMDTYTANLRRDIHGSHLCSPKDQ